MNLKPNYLNNNTLKTIALKFLYIIGFVRCTTLFIMLRKLEILLKVILTILLVGVTLTTISLYINESEIALLFAEVTCYTILPLLVIAISIDVKYN